MTLSDGGRASFREKQIHATSQGSEEEIRVILEVTLFFLLLCTLLLVPTRWSQSGSVEFHCAIRLDGAAEINLREEQFFFCSTTQTIKTKTKTKTMTMSQNQAIFHGWVTFLHTD